MKTVAKKTKIVDNSESNISHGVRAYTGVTKAKTKTFSPTSMKIIIYGLYKLQDLFDKTKYENINLLNKKNWNTVEDFWNDFTCSFSTKEFCEALGISDGGKSRLQIEAAIDKIFTEQIKLSTGDHTKWFPWFVEALYYHPVSSTLETSIGESADKSILLTFHPGVLSMALDHKNKYAYIDLLSYGKLKSIYSLKWYQIIKSYYNMEGKWGNKEGQWKTNEMSISELKETFGIGMNLYLDRTNNLIQKVVKNPIKEINDSGFEFTVEIQYKRGKNNKVEALWLLCTKKSTSLLPDNKKYSREEDSSNSLEIFLMKHKYPDEWAKTYESIKVETPFPLFDEYTEMQTLSAMKEKGFIATDDKTLN